MSSSYDDIAKAREELAADPSPAPSMLSRLDGPTALLAASKTAMTKLKGERDTEFVKRIVAAYFEADHELRASHKRKPWLAFR